MIRIALIFLIAVFAFVALRLILGNKNISNRQFGFIYTAMLIGIVLLYLGISGRLPWLFGALGAALPFIARSLPWIFRIVGLRSAWNWLRNANSYLGGAARHSKGQNSALNTRFLAMVLDHDTGKMDGDILEGPQKGAKLSSLNLADLLTLLQSVRIDADSENVLRAYLDREHPDWHEKWHQDSDQSGDGDHKGQYNESDSKLSARQAYEILGLEQGANKDDVKDAHRRLMQRVHPDRGGSDYLAARINEAKSVLFAHLDQ